MGKFAVNLKVAVLFYLFLYKIFSMTKDKIYNH